MKTLSINNNHFKNILKPQKNKKRLSFGMDFRLNNKKADAKDLYRALNLQTENWDKDQVQYYTYEGKNKILLNKDTAKKSGSYFKKEATKKGFMETFYNSNSKPSSINEYQNGKRYKTTYFDIFSNKISWVKYEDGSFGLYQNVGKNKTNIEMTKKYGDDVLHLNFDAVSKLGSTGGLSYSRMNGKDYKAACSIYWNYPSMTYNCIGEEKDKQEYLAVLQEFQRILKSKEYKSSFGKHKDFNNQLNEVIKYLKSNKAVFLH